MYCIENCKPFHGQNSDNPNLNNVILVMDWGSYASIINTSKKILNRDGILEGTLQRNINNRMMYQQQLRCDNDIPLLVNTEGPPYSIRAEIDIKNSTTVLGRVVSFCFCNGKGNCILVHSSSHVHQDRKI